MPLIVRVRRSAPLVLVLAVVAALSVLACPPGADAAPAVPYCTAYITPWEDGSYSERHLTVEGKRVAVRWKVAPVRHAGVVSGGDGQPVALTPWPVSWAGTRCAVAVTR